MLPVKIDLEVKFAFGFFMSILLLYTKYRIDDSRDIIMEEASEVKCIRLHENVNDMADLMCSCDVAISAAGSTLYKLCACRIPTITYILADNQMPGARDFESRGIMKCAGDVRDIGPSELASRLIEMVVELCDNEDERRTMAERQGIVVDGRGAERIVEIVVDYNDRDVIALLVRGN